MSANPPPTTTSLGTSSIARWEGAQTGQTINGTGFVAASTVYIDGVAMSTSFVSSTQLTFTIPRDVLWENGNKSVTVVSPAPGGGPSNAQTLSVTQPTYLEAEYRADIGRTMNGSTVLALADQSAKGDANRNLSQLTGAAQPTYVATDASYNGKPTLTFGGSQYMQTGAWTSPPANPVRHYWVGHQTAAAIILMFDGIANGNRHGFARNTATAIAFYSATAGTNSTLWDSTTKSVAVCEFNGGSSRFANSTKTLSAITHGGNSMTGYTLGSSYSAGFKMSGTFAHDIVVKSDLVSTAQHGEIMDYLGSRYGVTIGA